MSKRNGMVTRWSTDTLYELQRYLVHIYRGGFEDGVNAVQEKLSEEADIEPEDDVTEVQVSWEDVGSD